MNNAKKGEVEPKNVVIGFIISAIVLIIAIVFLVNINNKTEAATRFDCGNQLIGMGSCNPSCEKGEVKVKGYGCEDNADGTPIYCCVDPNYEPEDKGGDTDYRFDVYDIGLDPAELKGNCVQSQGWTYNCKTGKPLKVTMSVTNTGNFPIDVFANPKVGESYPKQGQAKNFKPGENKTLTVDLSLDSKKSYVIKAAAKCNTGECKTKFGDQGIFRQNDMQYITVIIG